MRILLVGEFSRLHNSLKEGLVQLGHEVVLVNNGDGFKDYPADISYKAKFFKSKLGNIPRQIWYRMFKFDLAQLEFGIRFYFKLKELKDFDVVQLINEAPIQTLPSFELYLLKKLLHQNKKTFLLCCGVDYVIMKYMLDKKLRYSIMDPYFEGIPEAKIQYHSMFDFVTKAHKKVHDYLYKNIQGVIASDLDYVTPLKENPKYLGLIPNPINTDTIAFEEQKIEDKIIIFLGINNGNSYKKGVHYFEKALEKIQALYPDKVEIIVTRSIPYSDYLRHYSRAHIVLDQVYSFDQGYNALEAMSRGKVVFTGAEREFLDHYGLQENEVAINALPDVDSIVNELSSLIEQPERIMAIGLRARAFIEREHHYIKTAKMYCDTWNPIS
ncbi:glycosyltransferase family protein [Flavobacterium sp.]|uniref:glycosyltransferase family protein n=1 Tax=Flavobacterium sp. TaxID=239 RepID=UPI002B4B697A|nr:glycosyltransferase [Flavobacterium sp.]HLP63165.1 glycosyltransferase [Flavobacterium sp.]